MDWGIFCTVIGTAIGVVGLIYLIVRNFKIDFNAKFELLEERIFQLAMGKSLKEIMLEQKNKGGE